MLESVGSIRTSSAPMFSSAASAALALAALVSEDLESEVLPPAAAAFSAFPFFGFPFAAAAVAAAADFGSTFWKFWPPSVERYTPRSAFGPYGCPATAAKTLLGSRG